MSKSVLPMFSSKSFMLSSLVFGSLIHFKSIFVYFVRKYCNLILLHVAVQFFQHHLLKRLSLWYILASLIIDQVTISVWVYLFAFYPVPLVCISGVSVCVCVCVCARVRACTPVPYCSFVVQSEVREPGYSSSVFLSQDSTGCLGSSVFPYKL